MKHTFTIRPTLFLPLLLAVIIISTAAAACSSGTDTATNSNTNVNTSTATASPSASTMPMASDSGSKDSGAMMAMDSSPNAASAPYDLQFLDTMSAHHQAAIEMAKPAETKSQHPELKTLARNIVDDQQKEIAQMKSWRDQWYAGKPKAMNMAMSGMMDSMKGMDMGKLNAASGNDFDLMFISMMTPHHEGAVTMAKEALMKAEHPEIRKLAQQIIDSQSREIAEMNKWKAAWSGSLKK